MKQLLSLTLVLLLASSVRAQNFRIIKDNLNCSYGLKDKNGAWVLEPIYTLVLEYTSGYYLVKDPLGDGIVTPSGKWLIECKYDQIDVQMAQWNIVDNFRYAPNTASVSNEGFFLIGTKGDEKHLINSRGKTIRKMTRDAALGKDGQTHFLIHEESPARATYMDTSGNVFIDRMEGKILPFLGRDYSLNGASFQDVNRVVSGKVRLIDKRGKVLLDDVFDMAMIASKDRICFRKNGKHGMMKTNGEMIIAPEYQWEIALTNPDYHTNGWVITANNGKKGVIRADGQRIVAPVYDKVYSTNRNDQLGWVVEEGTKKGVVDLEGNFLVPLEYDEITRFLFLNEKSLKEVGFVVRKGPLNGIIRPKISRSPVKFYDFLEPISEYSYSFSEAIGLGFIIQENGKYGVLKPDESSQSACVFDSYQRRSTSDQRYWFFNGHELTEFAFKQTALEQQKWELFIELEDQLIFQLSRQYLTVKLSGDGSRIESVSQEGNRFVQQGNMLVMNPNDSREVVVYNTVTKKRIHLENIVRIDYAGANRFVIRTRLNNAGLVDENGRLILDTLFNVIQVQNGGNHLWGSRQMTDGRYKWALMNGDGEQMVKTLFDQSFGVKSGDQLVKEGGKIGVFDTENFAWKIQPIDGCLYRKVDHFYASISLENKKGILRSDGTYLIQPVYDTIILLAGNCYINGFLQNNQPADFYWVAQQGARKILFHQTGQDVRIVQHLTWFKKSLLFEDTLFMTAHNYIRNYPVLDYSPSLHFLQGLSPEQVRKKKWNLWENSRIKSVIYDTINSQWERRKAICQMGYYSWVSTESSDKKQQDIQQKCQCAQLNQQNYGGVTYKLMSIGPKFATLSRDYISNQSLYGLEWGTYSSMPPMGSAPSSYWNFVEQNGVVRSIELNDIFPNNATLMDEFIQALQKREDLKLECSSVENMLEMINGNFGLTDEGVSLYLNQNHNNFYGDYMPIELYIPLENLEKHAESKWIVPLLRTE